MSALTDKQGRLAHLQKEWQALWNSKPERNFTSDEADNLKNWNTEMAGLGVEIDILKSFEAMAADIVGPGGQPVIDDAPRDDRRQPQQAKSFAERLAEDAGYKAFQKAGQGTFTIGIDDAEAKATVTLANGAPQNARLARMEPFPLEQRTVSDLMAQGTIDRGTLEYYEETTFTNAAATVAEGTAKPESALNWTLRTESLSKIATWIPATSEALQDISWLRSTIENRIVFMLRRVEEAQLINGNGIAPNLSGITNRSGIQTQAKGTDPVFDAILKAITLIQVNSFYEPDAIVMHPNDWRDLLLTRTADGLYILGQPSDPTAARRLWGLEVRATTSQTENTAIVGAFRAASQVFRRGGITVTASTEHASFFIENKVAILAEERLGLAVYRPSAFATVTGV